MLLNILIIIVVALGIYIWIQYNSFIKLINRVKEAFSTMDVYLKKRCDLVPNLVGIVKEYTRYESNVLKKIIELRNMSYTEMSMEDKINVNQQISSEVPNIIIIAENYPDLKANHSFSELINQLTKIEDEIGKSRKYYNAVVRNLNTKIEMFPNNIIAKLFRFETCEMFEISQDERNNVKVENK